MQSNRVVRKEQDVLTRRDFLRMSGTAAAALVAGASELAIDAPSSIGGEPVTATPTKISGVTLLSWNANEIPSALSWKPETARKADRGSCGSLAIHNAAITRTRPYRGTASLELDVNLVGYTDQNRDSEHRFLCQGEARVDLRYQPPVCTPERSKVFPLGSPRDLRGAKITARVYVPEAGRGPRIPPNGLQLFIKSVQEVEVEINGKKRKQEKWIDYYGNWKNIESGWNSLDLVVDAKPRYGDKKHDFLAQQVGILGLKIGTGDGSQANFNGKIWLDDVTIEWSDGSKGIYDFEQIESALDQLQRTKVRWVSLIPTCYMDDKYSTAIHPDNQRTGARTYSDDELKKTIRELHQRGFKVLLKPHIDVIELDNDKKEVWRAQLKPSDPIEWFDSYNNFIFHYARLAQEFNVEMFAVGTELDSMQIYAESWVKIIQESRKLYKGPLTYAANWNSGDEKVPQTLPPEFKAIKFWDKLDFAGIDAYFPLSDERDPSLQDLLMGWIRYDGEYGRHNWMNEIETWQAQIKKPIIFTEIGYPSADFAALNPWSVPSDPVKAVVNLELQARCYRAALETFAAKPWFYGIFWWGWSPYADAGGACDLSYTTQNKPAKNLL